MLFNSATFVFLHLFIFAAYWLSPKQSWRLFFLAIGSIVFYGWFYWPGLFIIGGSILVNYFLAIKIDQSRSKQWLTIAVVINLLVLVYFKYVEFLARSFLQVLATFGLSVDMPVPPQWLPLGISFFTFQIVAYLVDVYKQKIHAEKNFLIFSVFVGFYGQLIAGPIVRSHEFMPQLLSKREFRFDQLQLGFFFFITGLMLKVTVADTLAQFVDHGFDHIDKLQTHMAWLTIYAFAIQILCDFWGYSTIAVGSALMLGIKLPINFNSPYSSRSLREFWRRWHITLSTWLRDYLYIPLGGNRKNTQTNLIATMTLGGLWHGASWNFIIWGLLHGVWLATERVFTKHQDVDSTGTFLSDLVKKLLVFHGVCLLWVFFRAQSFSDAVLFLRQLLVPPYEFSSSVPATLSTLIIIFVIFQKRVASYLIDDKFLRFSLAKQVALSLLILLVTLSYAQARLDFIYFVF
ncbi:MAG: MBOAT family protein [Gammaproteobacteria bacterium]|nr:MBOAT family protein [Gammaproteobacteria bacterium]